MKQLQNLKTLKAQKGVTLIELMVYMVIAALVLASVVGIITLVRGDNKIDTEGKRLQFGMEKVMNFLATSPDTSAVDNALAIRIGAVPPDAVQGTNVITTKFGGNATYAAASLNNPNDAVSVTNDRLDEKTCLNYTKAQGSSFQRVSVNGTVVKAPTDTNVQEGALVGACNNNAAGNTIIFERQKA